MVLVATAAPAEPLLPWPLPGSPPLPPDYTVPYLPAVGKVLCKYGEHRCLEELGTTLVERTDRVNHEARTYAQESDVRVELRSRSPIEVTSSFSAASKAIAQEGETEVVSPACHRSYWSR